MGGRGGGDPIKIILTESLLLLLYQVKMRGCNYQSTGKYERKCLVSNISHIKFITYIRKFTTVNILGYISYQDNSKIFEDMEGQLVFWDTLTFQTLFKVNLVSAVISAFCDTRHSCNFLPFP